MGLRQPNPYQLMRQRAGQQATADNQVQQDAIKRRLARLGNLQSGAAMKIQQQAENDALQRRNQALEGIDVQEAQDVAQKQEAERSRQFASQEAEKGRGFQSQEAQLGRQFTSTEADRARKAAAEESQIGRNFQQGLAQKELEFKNTVFNAENGSRIEQMELAKKEFGRDTQTNYLNALNAALESGNPEAFRGILMKMNEDVGLNTELPGGGSALELRTEDQVKKDNRAAKNKRMGIKSTFY